MGPNDGGLVCNRDFMDLLVLVLTVQIRAKNLSVHCVGLLVFVSTVQIRAKTYLFIVFSLLCSEEFALHI
jgi:hypothetical protein